MTNHRYRIVLSGQLGDVSRQAFDGLQIEQVGENTELTGDLDQAALHGVLNRAYRLGLELVEAVRLPPT